MKFSNVANVEAMLMADVRQRMDWLRQNSDRAYSQIPKGIHEKCNGSFWINSNDSIVASSCTCWLSSPS